MELRHIEAFVAVAEELHFGRAAARLHITQPALSRQLSRLEHDLGVELVQRTKRHVELTAAGQAYLDEAVRVLAGVQRSVRVARRVARGEVGQLRIGHVDSASHALLASVLRDFTHRHDGVRVTLEEGTTVPLLQAIRDNALDVALLRLPADEPPDPALRTAKLLDESLVVAVAGDHELASESEVAMADLAGMPFVMLPRRVAPEMADRVVQLCGAAGFSPTVQSEGCPVSSLITLVAAGVGVAVVPTFVSAHCSLDGVRYVPIGDNGATLPLHLVWREAGASSVVDAFVTSTTEAAQALRGDAPAGATGP